MKLHKLEALFLSMLIGAVMLVPNVARATNGAQFTSLSAEYVELDMGPKDGDEHADDLAITFTETGTGNSSVVDITVSAIRDISITCVTTTGSFSVNVTEPVTYEYPDGRAAVDSSTFTPDDNGHLTGTVFIPTTFRVEVCPQSDPTTGVPTVVYAFKDYSVIYTDVTVTDNENGGASATLDRAEPGYTDSNLVTFGTGDLVIVGFECAFRDAENGGCATN